MQQFSNFGGNRLNACYVYMYCALQLCPKLKTNDTYVLQTCVLCLNYRIVIVTIRGCFG